MMTKEMQIRFNNAVEDLRGQFEVNNTVFDKLYDRERGLFVEACADLIHGAFVACDYGFITVEERTAIVEEIQIKRDKVISEFVTLTENAIGTEEYAIQWLLFKGYCTTRKEAEKEVKEWS